MVHGCHAVTGGPACFTLVPAAFLQQHNSGLPIWVPREGTPLSGYGAVSNARAIEQG
jgi:2'-hydroxyisoflavone reductase